MIGAPVEMGPSGSEGALYASRENRGKGLVTVLASAPSFLPAAALADYAKTVAVQKNVPFQAITTWYVDSCTQSGGVGSYSIEVAPSKGTLSFSTVNGPAPDCPAGSPSLPASAGFYTWTAGEKGKTTDYFQLLYQVNGQSEVIDVTVDLTTKSSTCYVSPETLASVPGIDNSRQKVGVGEWVSLETKNPVSWTVSGGGTLSKLVTHSGVEKCSGNGSTTMQGTQACLTAPASSSTVVVSTTTLDDGSLCSDTFTVAQPTGLIFRRLQSPAGSPDYLFEKHLSEYRAGMISGVFLTPGDVSFANIMISEHDDPKPHFDPNYNLLFALEGTKAWLVGCDKDVRGSNQADEQDPWIYVVGSEKENQTTFSIVETSLGTLSSGEYQYYKGQVQALSSDGTLVSAIGPASVLTVQGKDHNDLQTPTVVTCPGYVKSQFKAVP